MDSREKSILRTLLYADIFDYPLTKEEIFKFLISGKKINNDQITELLKSRKLPLETSQKYFYLSGKKDLVEKRQQRKVASNRKLKFAKKIIGKISFIPTIKFIGISGALAMENSDDNDDIDIFVITKNNSVWITRLLLVVLLTMLGVYRNRQTKNYSDKICLNMILDKFDMQFGKEDQDLYTAHEIVQLLPIFDKGKTYEEFIRRNDWINKFIPNFSINKNYVKREETIFDKLLEFLFSLLFLEKLSQVFQLNYMKKHRTKEVIREGFLKFHPFDYKTFVLKNYKRKLSKFDL